MKVAEVMHGYTRLCLKTSSATPSKHLKAGSSLYAMKAKDASNSFGREKAPPPNRAAVIQFRHNLNSKTDGLNGRISERNV
jgi:hypothetical protein